MPSATRYRLLAIDLDGTLLDSQQRLPARNRAALHAAHQSGLKVVLCTGRSFTETRPILDEIGLDLDAMVAVGGALLTEVTSGKTIDRAEIALDLALESAEWFRRRGYAVLWLHDASEAGFDGYLVDGPRRHPAIDRWLQITPCRMRQIDRLPDDRQAPLRVTIVDDNEVLGSVSAEFRRAFGGRLASNVIRVPTYGFTVLEAFEAAVSKWHGIEKLCRRWGIDPARTVAVGDDVNDVAMLRAAGLGVAVANATPEARSAARRVVGGNDDCGVADLIEQLLRG